LIEAASGMENRRSSSAMHRFTAILITLLLATPAMSVELFRYRGAAMDGGTLSTFSTAMGTSYYSKVDHQRGKWLKPLSRSLNRAANILLCKRNSIITIFMIT